jgi:hypothetical protein
MALGLVVLCTGWRTRVLLTGLRESRRRWHGNEWYGHGGDNACGCCSSGCCCLCCVALEVCCYCACCCGLGQRNGWDEFKRERTACGAWREPWGWGARCAAEWDSRFVALLQFLLLARDLLMLPLAAACACCLYKLPALAGRLSALLKRPLPEAPQRDVLSATVQARSKTGANSECGSGIQVRVILGPAGSSGGRGGAGGGGAHGVDDLAAAAPPLEVEAQAMLRDREVVNPVNGGTPREADADAAIAAALAADGRDGGGDDDDDDGATDHPGVDAAKPKLHAVGPAFMRGLEKAVGSTLVAVGQGLLPLKLSDLGPTAKAGGQRVDLQVWPCMLQPYVCCSRSQLVSRTHGPAAGFLQALAGRGARTRAVTLHLKVGVPLQQSPAPPTRHTLTPAAPPGAVEAGGQSAAEAPAGRAYPAAGMHAAVPHSLLTLTALSCCR